MIMKKNERHSKHCSQGSWTFWRKLFVFGGKRTKDPINVKVTPVYNAKY